MGVSSHDTARNLYVKCFVIHFWRYTLNLMCVFSTCGRAVILTSQSLYTVLYRLQGSCAWLVSGIMFVVSSINCFWEAAPVISVNFAFESREPGGFTKWYYLLFIFWWPCQVSFPFYFRTLFRKLTGSALQRHVRQLATQRERGVFLPRWRQSVCLEAS